MTEVEAALAPWLSVGDAQRAVDFYAAAFGAVESYRLEGDEALAVAELRVGTAAFWVQDDVDALPEERGSIRLILSVADPDALFDRAVAAGATVVAPVTEDHGWRTGRIIDPFGHGWEIGRQLDA
ncbi:MAG: VOC family protein [Actinomycetota bacterium]